MLLVTGASGLLGANLVLHARDTGYEVVGLCHSHPLNIPGVEMHAVDLTDRAAAKEKLKVLKPAAIIHCAAATNVDWCEDHTAEARAINAQAPASLAKFAKEIGANFIHVSTDAVFDGDRGRYIETDKPAPLNVYAKSKLQAEQEVTRVHPSALIARINIYGWNSQPKCSLAEWVLQELAAGKTVSGFTDVYFSPLLANDLAKILLTMLDRGLHGLYHVVGGERISKYEFARRVASTFGFDPEKINPVSMESAGLRAPRPRDISLDTGKVRAALGKAMPTVGKGLERFRDLQKSGYSQQLRSYSTGVKA